jgi:hypothetical protein
MSNSDIEAKIEVTDIRDRDDQDILDRASAFRQSLTNGDEYPDGGLITDEELADFATQERKDAAIEAVREFIKRVNSPLIVDVDFDMAARDTFRAMFPGESIEEK